MALRIEDSGFLISCATSAAKCSIASMRAHSALRRLGQRGGQRADLVASQQQTAAARCRRGPCPRASRPRRAARRRIGRAMVSDRYQDSSTVSASARPNSARIDMRTVNRLLSTSRASRVSRTMPTVWRSRSTGSATVTSSRLSLGAADIGRHLAALVGVVEAQLLLHVGLPVEAGGALARRRSPTRGRRLVRQQSPAIES